MTYGQVSTLNNKTNDLHYKKLISKMSGQNR